MQVKKVPKRQCVSCREMKPKKELIRVVKTTEGEIVFDSTGKKAGRGAYICKDEKCFENAKKRKCLDRVFETKIKDEVYDKIKEELKQL